MSDPFRLQLRFWGVRGSTPTPNLSNLMYGGNTTCLDVRSGGGQLIVIDGGSGIRNLGLSLNEEQNGQSLDLKVFLTHFHWDHIQGLPFFSPLFGRANKVTFHSFPPADDIHETLEGQMTHPYFPVSFDLLAASRSFVQMPPESRSLCYGDIAISSFPLNHPQGACGYKIASDGAVIVFASDLEHGHPSLDGIVRKESEGADVLIYDAQYTPEEYLNRKGWGHSTYEEAARVAADAGVKQLILFHHDPAHDDGKIDLMVKEAKKIFPATSAARENQVLEL